MFSELMWASANEFNTIMHLYKYKTWKANGGYFRTWELGFSLKKRKKEEKVIEKNRRRNHQLIVAWSLNQVQAREL